MAYIGKKITDTATGDTFEFTATTASSSGQYVRVLQHLHPGGFLPVMHFHTLDEHFRVLEGELSAKLGKDTFVLRAGEDILLPRNRPHTHYNSGKSVLVMEQTVSPALDAESFLENFFGLLCDGKVKNGEPEFLQIIAWLRHLEARTYLAALPQSLQDGLARLLSPLAHWRGYRPVYPQYAG